eukprot:8975403-Lingulodinium_polyedra.AAC.1
MPVPEVPALIEASAAKSGRVLLQQNHGSSKPCEPPGTGPCPFLLQLVVGVEIMRGKCLNRLALTHGHAPIVGLALTTFAQSEIAALARAPR